MRVSGLEKVVQETSGGPTALIISAMGTMKKQTTQSL